MTRGSSGPGNPGNPGAPSDFASPSGAELLAIAVGAARAAGRLLADRDGAVAVAATKSSPTDVVTEMDRRAEELIRSRILAARPGDALLGEEGGQTGGTGDAPVRWVIDPLDGTVNYLYGLADWAVSIAAEASGVVLAGAVFVPRRGEMFTAVRGGGGWLESAAAEGDRVRLRCRPGVPLEQALVATGFGYQAGRRKVQGEVVAALLPRVRDIRRAGVAAVDLCSVAAGRVDAYYERGLNQWDYAAGALIAAEAGAVVGGLGGAPPSTSMTIAAGPNLFGALAEVLAALDAERDALGGRIAEPEIVFRRGIDERYAGFTSGRNRSGSDTFAPGRSLRARRGGTWQNSRPESGTTKASGALLPRSDRAPPMEGDGASQWQPTTIARVRPTMT
jgi:myo-inositol-1(or 4)-monophosphatase